MIVHRTWTVGLLGLLAACGGNDSGNSAGNAAVNGTGGTPRAEASSTIGDALAGSAEHRALVQALQSSGLIDTLRGAGPYTVFAPTDAAFDALPEDARARLTAPDQRDRLITLLSYHIVPGTVTTADITGAIARAPGGRAELATVTGANLSLFREGEAIVVSDGANTRARITRGDQTEANGIVHSIDTVLMPGEGR